MTRHWSTCLLVAALALPAAPATAGCGVMMQCFHCYLPADGDWAQDLRESSILRFRSGGKAWDWQVDTENQNYDHSMVSDNDMDRTEVVAELERWSESYLVEVVWQEGANNGHAGSGRTATGSF